MGKTRLAAELAGEAHREGATVLYAAGTGAPEAALAAIARARDDAAADAARARRRRPRARRGARRAARARAGARRALPVLVLATGLQAAALARLEPRDSIVLEPLDADGVAGDRRLLRAGRRRRDPGRGAAGHERRRRAPRPRGGERVGAARGDAPRRRRRRTARRPAAARRARSRPSWPAASSSSSRRASARASSPATATTTGAGRLPVQGPRDVRRRRRRVLLRARAARRRAGRASRRRAAARDRRPVRQRQVVGRAGRAAARARGRRAAGQRAAGRRRVIRPGEHPLRELRRATRRLVARAARRARGRPVRGAVHRLPGRGTSAPSSSPRWCARGARRRTVVVLAVRADFYGRCAAYPELSRLLGANHVLVGPMSRDELRRAIERPAQRVGLSVEPELVEALLADVEGQPGALPLLSTALLELWRERDGRRLRLAAYARSGGVHGAVARLAEEAFVALDPEHQAVARTLLLRLADEDEGGAVVRRRIALDELGRRASARGRRAGSPTAGCSRSPTARSRSRTRRCCASGRGCAAGSTRTPQGRRLHRRLGDAARAWDADARDPGGLYRGARLAAALDWAAGHDAELNATERAFLDASRRASGRAQRRLRMVLAGVAALLVARGDRRRRRARPARQRARRGDRGRGAAASARRRSPRTTSTARCCSPARAWRWTTRSQTRGNLLATLLKSPAAIGVIARRRRPARRLDLSPDGRTLALVDTDGTLPHRHRHAAPVAPPRTIPGTVHRARRGRLRRRCASATTAPGSRSRRPAGRPGRRGTHRVLARLRTSSRARLRGCASRRTGARCSPPISDLRTASPRRPALRRPQRPAARRRSAVIAGRADRDADGRAPTAGTSSRPRGRPDRDPRRAHAAPAAEPAGRRRRGGAEPGRSHAAARRPRRHGALPRPRRPAGRARPRASRRRGRPRGVQRRRPHRRHGRRGQPRDRLGRRAGGGPRDARRATRQITGLAISRDGRTLYTGGLDGKVLIWDLAGDRRLGRAVRRSARTTPTRAFDVSSATREPGRPPARRRASTTAQSALIDAAHAAAARAVPRGPARAGARPRRSCRAAGCSPSAATRLPRAGRPAHGRRSSSALRGHRGAM